MLERSLAVLFFLKKTKSSEINERSVYMRVTVNGLSCEWSIKRKWYKKRWSQKYNRATDNKEDARSLNEFLEALTTEVHNTRIALFQAGRTITAELLKTKLLGEPEPDSPKKVERLIMQEFQSHNSEMEKLVDKKEVRKATLTRYETTFSHTQNFLKWKYEVEDLNIEKLDFDFISSFDFWLKTERNCAHNTTMKYICNFKKIVLRCVKKRWITNPFGEFKIKLNKVRKFALTELELDKLMKIDIPIFRLALVRDVFVLCCLTGLAYKDVFLLKVNDIVEYEQGKKCILINRYKSDEYARIPLLEDAERILNFYRDHFKVKPGYAMPVLSNQKMNAYLKELADICGITIKLTTHVARHTFASTVALNNGVPIKTVQIILGHATVSQTEHYAVLSNQKIAEDMEKCQNRIKEKRQQQLISNKEELSEQDKRA